ncbi:hypothetical protein LCX93_00290 [Sulfurimonas sp. SWIR-19]|uniref:hypothetical protein n=1 Tax=Sulfurimonas sp. SWIR-19 TaxID=2878390 RepID=UPI001CF19FE0|nr:hypothetical protein [Sulfurimonas sp. SWIR-19]UCN00387.1 hypothetical protein LCX93_00290 [Sulfurimonas sp. SWIR-19]
MITHFFKKYLSIIFIIATFIGVFHHHNDLKQHNDCKICTVQSNLSHADTPVAVDYLTELEILHESIITPLISLHVKQVYTTLHARAPPKIS